MGKNLQKNSNKKQQKKPVEPQSEEQQESVQQIQGSEGEDLDQFDGLEDGNADDSILLKKIEDKINDCEDAQKLSWGAIYSVKQKQASLNQDMHKQIQQIKDKYERIRLPLLLKISQAVSGKHLQKSLYAENELTKNINLNKVKPAPLPDYWVQVFQSSGLINNEIDIEVLQSLTIFTVQLLDSLVQHIKIHMQFKQNPYFSNKSFDLQISGNTVDNTFVKKLSEPIKYKGQKNEQSLFSILFDGSDNQQLRQTAIDIYRAYISSTYFYFYQADDLDAIDGQEEDSQEGEDGEDDDQDQSDEDEGVKANKKVKPNPALQKPQCKNQ